MSTFSSLGLSEALLKALPELGIESPTEIQQKAIPLLVEKKRDFIGLAQTGTGKTAAFGLPLLDAIHPEKKKPQALVLVPTRELGQQVAQNLSNFAKYIRGVRVLAVYGGAAIGNQIRELKQNVQIVIATPGRLLDLVQRKAIKLEEIEYLVLDEADEMLNMGFQEDLDEILSHTPETKATWLFSATMAPEIRKIVHKYMEPNPAEVKVNAGQQVNVNIEHQYVVVKPADKTEALKRILDFNENMSGIIFCRTKIGTQQLADDLTRHGYPAEALHGDLSQQQRDKVMRRFKAHSLKVIVATDVAARGIDVNNLSHVIHYDLPDDFDYYLHRSGRTARAGKKGISLTLISAREAGKLQMLERKLKLKFSKVEIPKGVDILSQKTAQWTAAVLSQEVPDELSKSLIAQAEKSLEGLTTAELVAKLLAKELGKLIYAEAQQDINEKDGEHRSTGISNGKMDRFFINIGIVDKVKQKELIEFICDYAHLSKRDFGNVDMKKSFSFFEVSKNVSKDLSEKFKGLEIEGRQIRVNKDHPRNPDKEHSGEKRRFRENAEFSGQSRKPEGKRKKFRKF